MKLIRNNFGIASGAEDEKQRGLFVIILGLLQALKAPSQ